MTTFCDFDLYASLEFFKFLLLTWTEENLENIATDNECRSSAITIAGSQFWNIIYFAEMLKHIKSKVRKKGRLRVVDI